MLSEEASICGAGTERAVPLPEQAAQSTKATGDLLRRFKEMGANMKSHPPPSAAEQDLLVCFSPPPDVHIFTTKNVVLELRL